MMAIYKALVSLLLTLNILFRLGIERSTFNLHPVPGRPIYQSSNFMVNLNITVDNKSQYKCKNILRLSKPGPANPKINQNKFKEILLTCFCENYQDEKWARQMCEH